MKRKQRQKKRKFKIPVVFFFFFLHVWFMPTNYEWLQLFEPNLVYNHRHILIALALTQIIIKMCAYAQKWSSHTGTYGFVCLPQTMENQMNVNFFGEKLRAQSCSFYGCNCALAPRLLHSCVFINADTPFDRGDDKNKNNMCYPMWVSNILCHRQTTWHKNEEREIAIEKRV